LITPLVSVAPLTISSFVCAIAIGAKSIAKAKAHDAVFISFLPSDSSFSQAMQGKKLSLQQPT
jgi:hypothetical protein